MSWDSEFNTQWQTFLNIVAANIRREVEKYGSLGPSSANSIIQSEVAKWSISTHYNGAWLQNLKRAHPALGEEFQTTLKEITADPSISLTLGPPLLPIFAVAGLMGGTFSVARWLGMPLVGQIGGPLAVAVLVTPIARNLWIEKGKKTTDAVTEQLRSNLEPIGRKLRDIAARADKVSKESRP